MLQRVEESASVVNCIPELSLISSKTMWQHFTEETMFLLLLNSWPMDEVCGWNFHSVQRALKGQFAKKCLG